MLIRFALTDFEDYDYFKKFGENRFIATDGAVAKRSHRPDSAGLYRTVKM